MAGNYVRPILEMLASGMVPIVEGEVSHLTVLHDDWCGVFQGKPCNCEPGFRFDGVEGKDRRLGNAAGG